MGKLNNLLRDFVMTDIFNKSYRSLLCVPFACIACALLCASASLVHAGTIGAGNQTALYISDQASGANLFGWGANGSGQIGDDSAEDRLTPVKSEEDGPWLAVATNLTGVSNSSLEGHSLGIKADGVDSTQGTLWAWGDNSFGQLGLGDTTNKMVPTQIGSASNWIAVEAGSAFSMALNAEGEIWVWGDNRFGQLGAGVVAYFQSTPTQLADKDGTTSNNDQWVSIAAGADYALAVHSITAGSSYGYIYGWGRNSLSQIGLGHNSSPVVGPSSATRIAGTTLWRSVEAGISASFAINSSGHLYSWGQGGFGGLGLGPSQGTSIGGVISPTREATQKVFAKVSAGSSHTLALTSTGQLFATGQNASGQLGKVGSNLYNTFQFIDGDVAEIAAGNAFSVIVKEDGSVLTAGSNARGQLGNGTTSSVNSFTATSLGAVDLSVDSISITSDISVIAPGDTLDFQIIIRNNGTGTIDSALVDATELTIALSPSTIFSAEGETLFVEGFTVEVPNADVADIKSGGSIAVDITATIPNPILANSYYILVELDANDTIEESDELNNSGVSEVEQQLNFKPDLEIEIIAPITLASVSAGATLTVDVNISNAGTGSIPSGVGSGFKYNLLLSSLADESVGKVYELAITLPVDESPYKGGLNNGASVTRSITVSVPEEVTLGMYYLGAVVDSGADIDELSESNNTAFTSSDLIEIIGLSIEEALDIDGVTFPSVSDPKLVLSGDSDFFGTEDLTAITPLVGDGASPNVGSLSSPSLFAGESASLTFTFEEPREVSFRWKSATSSSQNNLFFGANLIPIEPETAGSPARLSGTKDWEEVSYIVPKDIPVGFTYVQGVTGPDDYVFIDELRVSSPITLPDYIVQTIDYEVGDYVLQKDRLTVTVTGINRGADFPLPDDFSVQVWLSLDEVAGDEDDVSIGELNSFQILDNGSRFIYQAIFSLPEELLDAPYYLLARVDSQNSVTEYNESAVPFSIDDNNFKFSDSAGLNIDRRADLRVTNFIGVEEVSIFAGGPTNHADYNPLAGENETTVFGQFIIVPKPGENSELAVRFDVVNAGLAAVEGVEQNFDVSVFLAPSRDPSPGEIYEVAAFVEDMGLSVGGGITYEVTTNISEAVLPGDFYYVGVLVDASDNIAESKEDNNTTLSETNEVFIGEYPLNVALNDDTLTETLAGDLVAQTWTDGFIPANENNGSPSSPWFGQTAEFAVDSSLRAAARSGPVASGAVSFMETLKVIDVGAEPRFVSFKWKVSSQLDVTEAGIVEDILEFSIREGSSGPFARIAKISGEVDWTAYQYVIEEPGNYTLRWSYTENGDGERGGQDAGWVDDFNAQAPDFSVTGSPAFSINSADFVEINGPVDGVLSPGDSFDLSFTAENLGEGAYANVRGQIRLTKARGVAANLDWNQGNFEDVVLFDGFIPLELNDLTLVIPNSISEAEAYYVGVWLEYSRNIPEDSEANNLVFTDLPVISVDPLVSFADAVDNPTNDWSLIGDGRWFPVSAMVGDPDDIAFDNVDAVSAPDIRIGESAGFEAIIDGPKLMNFKWRTNSLSNVNYMELRINGVAQEREFGANAGDRMRMSGDSGWVEEAILIPSGTQVVAWVFVKNGEEQGFADMAYVDVIDLDAYSADAPDLAILSVDYNGSADPQTGIQQYALERDQFPLTVIVANRGGAVSGAAYGDLDLEVRLSEDIVFDFADEVVGHLGVTEVLESGARLVFSGNIDLPVSIDAKKYYLLVRVSSLDPDFAEIEDPLLPSSGELLSNNNFESRGQDVEILHLPRLVFEMGAAPGVKVYYPKEALYFEWSLINIGLGDISGLQSYTQRIELWRFDEGADFSDLSAAGKVIDLASITESEYLPGVLSRDDISESTLEYKTTLALPRAGVLLEALGETDSLQEDESVDVISKLEKLEGYTFFLVIVRDQVIEQSSNLSIELFSGARFKIAAFPYDTTQPFVAGESTLTTFDEWRAFNEELLVTSGDLSGVLLADLPDADPSVTYPGSGDIEGLFYYALNLPFSTTTRLEDDAVKGAVLERMGTVFVAGIEYQRLTFPIVRGAEDLKYTVQASDDMVIWEDLIVMESPYLDSRGTSFAGYYGAQALTDPTPGSGSLITLQSPALDGQGYMPVVSVVDHNYTATVTVRDYVPFGAGARFMRLLIEKE